MNKSPFQPLQPDDPTKPRKGPSREIIAATAVGSSVFLLIGELTRYVRSRTDIAIPIAIMYAALTWLTLIYYPTAAKFVALFAVPVLFGFLPLTTILVLIGWPCFLIFFETHFLWLWSVAGVISLVEFTTGSDSNAKRLAHVILTVVAGLPIVFNYIAPLELIVSPARLCKVVPGKRCQQFKEQVAQAAEDQRKQIESDSLEQDKARGAVPAGCAVGSEKHGADEVDLVDYLRFHPGGFLLYANESGKVRGIESFDNADQDWPGAKMISAFYTKDPNESSFDAKLFSLQAMRLDVAYDACRIMFVNDDASGKRVQKANVISRFIKRNQTGVPLFQSAALADGQLVAYLPEYSSRVGRLSDCIETRSKLHHQIFCKGFGLVESYDFEKPVGFTLQRVSSRDKKYGEPTVDEVPFTPPNVSLANATPGVRQPSSK